VRYPGRSIEQITVASIRMAAGRTVEDYPAGEVEALARAIEATGRIEQPLLVRPAGGEAEAEWLVIAGGLRLAAAVRLGWTDVPCQVREVDDRTAALVALLEDQAGKTEHILPLGWALLEAMEATGWSQAEVVAATRLPASTVCEAVRSARAVPPEVLDEAAAECDVPGAVARTVPRSELRRIRQIGDPAERKALLTQVLVRLRERSPVDGRAEAQLIPILVAHGAVRLDPGRIGRLGSLQLVWTLLQTLWLLGRTWLQSSPRFAGVRRAKPE
jgi:ParB-like chromosome segregation protein Spo0J